MSKKQKQTRKVVAQASAPLAQISTVTAKPHIVVTVLRAGGILILGLEAWSFVQPDARLWGVHHLTFLPVPLAAAVALLGVLLLSPLGAHAVERFIVRFRKFGSRPAIIGAVIAAMVFSLLSVSVPLLGDGPLWIVELSWIGKFHTRGSETPPNRWKSRKEPLEIVLHELTFRAVMPFRPPDTYPSSPDDLSAINDKRTRWFEHAAELTYAWLSIAAGALAVFVTLRFARRRLPPMSRLPFVLTLFSGGGMLLFFGYVEHYSWVSLAVISFLLAGLDATFSPRRFPWLPLLLFVLSVACHLAAVFLLPPLVFLLYQWRQFTAKGEAAISPLRIAWQVVAVFALLGVAAYVWVRGWKGWLTIAPLIPAWSRDGYALLSITHALDLFNLFALVAAPAILLIAVLRRVRRTVSPKAEQSLFLALATGSGIALVISFDPNLGMARDWDLLAVALWPLMMLGAWTVARIDWGRARPLIVATVAGLVALITLPYILVQASEATSVRRFETLLHMDATRSAYGWENLSVHYRSTGNIDGRIRALRAACVVDNNPRYRVNLAAALRTNGQLSEAEPLCIGAVREKPQYVGQLVYLAVAYGQKGNEAKARQLLELARDLNPQDSTAAEVLRELGRHPDNTPGRDHSSSNP